ncbi:BBSome-interacting protein 1 isoform X1 [Mustela erminea]|uniref:BBSome-interacting protein 1 isoform X1 n=1 Tax=Mustela erminea TaxID=36723 RepID=UPI0013866CE6|nr:BBSome-interacting protein 1 isoform X1 [Mustela erminea]XP_032169782.1 BBSome-interacting protein 1 isoform X1 [Mustela erminea]
MQQTRPAFHRKRAPFLSLLSLGDFHLNQKSDPSPEVRAGPGRPARVRLPAAPPAAAGLPPRRGRRPGPRGPQSRPAPGDAGPERPGLGSGARARGLGTLGRGPPGRPGGRGGREPSSQDFSHARNTPPNVPPPSKNENSASARTRSSPSLASAPRTLLSPERVPEGAGPRRRAPGLGPGGNRSPPSASRGVGQPRPACGAPRRRPDPRPPGPALT